MEIVDLQEGETPACRIERGLQLYKGESYRRAAPDFDIFLL